MISKLNILGFFLPVVFLNAQVSATLVGTLPDDVQESSGLIYYNNKLKGAQYYRSHYFLSDLGLHFCANVFFSQYLMLNVKCDFSILQSAFIMQDDIPSTI